MNKELKQWINENLKQIEQCNLKTKLEYLNHFSIELSDAQYEYDKINSYTAPEEISYRTERLAYYKAMYLGVKRMLP